MQRNPTGLVLVTLLLLTLSFASAEERGKPGGKSAGGRSEGGRPGGKPPGGNWSEPKSPTGNSHKEGLAADEHNKSSQPSGAQGAAAGAAASNRNNPKATGAQGAAAGAAAANRNNPQVTGAEGAAAGAAAANRNNPAVSGAAGATAGYAAVRNSYDRPDLYGAAWYTANPGVWKSAGWGAGAAYAATNWTVAAAHCGYGALKPISYNFGTNVTCVNGVVLLDGQELGTAEAFSQQADDIAQAGAAAATAADDQWLPLGVFAMVRNEQQHPQLILQFAVNQRGILRGNYTDEATDHTLPIQGAVDQKSQRAAWTVGSNSATVMEAGFSNMTQGEAPALLHKNGKTDRWILVRLDKPKE